MRSRAIRFFLLSGARLEPINSQSLEPGADRSLSTLGLSSLEKLAHRVVLCAVPRLCALREFVCVCPLRFGSLLLRQRRTGEVNLSGHGCISIAAAACKYLVLWSLRVWSLLGLVLNVTCALKLHLTAVGS